VVAADADDATLTAVAALVAEAEARLIGIPRRPRRPFDASRLGTRPVDPDRSLAGLDAMADRAVAGVANPMRVELSARILADGAEADVEFGPAFEGAPGRVHGGMVAAVLDDLLGAAMATTGAIGFTGRLTVHYHAPVPIQTPLRVRMTTGARDGRKLAVHGEVRLDDRVLTSADALMVLVDAEHFRTPAADLLARGAEAR
jgi:acyl-coenzyme A thioesterase PaaI-like protein